MSKVWFVTGSSRGLGRHFVEAALSRGDQVAATARDTASLDDLVATHGEAVLPLALDVTDRAAVFTSVRRAAEHFGRLDVIVNNAGYAQVGAIEELTEQQLRDQVETNLFGAVWVVQAALPHLRDQGAGHIIQLSSVAGLLAMPLGGAYHASKWALEGLNESLAEEVADFGIRVTVVEPGGFATRNGKNPDPLANGHVAEPDPAYDGLRQRLAGLVGRQPAGDPAAAAQALLTIVDSDAPPLRVLFGQGSYPMLPADLRRPAQDLGRLAGPLGRGARQARPGRSVTSAGRWPPATSRLRGHGSAACPTGSSGTSTNGDGSCEMRVLLSTYGSRGDVEPLVALAVQVRSLGADVRVCAPPDEELTELVTRHGVPLVPFDRPWRSWERPPTAEQRRQRVADLIAAQYGTVAEAAAGCDVVVATAMSQFVGPSVAEELGIPYRCVLFCPDVLDGLDGLGFDELFGKPVNAHRASIGLPPVSDVGTLLFTARPLLAADPTLGPWRGPGRFGVIQTGAWLLPDERPLPAELLAFLDAGDQPVYAGFGSMRTVDEDGARAVVEAIRAQGRRVLVGRGWAGLAPTDDQDDCSVIGEVNQQELFTRVAAVVHHGGAGTTTTAARAGAPQVVVPQGGDQTYWAGRVADLGIGAAHDGPTPTVHSLSAALRTALDPATRARATAVAAGIGTDGARTAARLLLAGGAAERR